MKHQNHKTTTTTKTIGFVVAIIIAISVGYGYALNQQANFCGKPTATYTPNTQPPLMSGPKLKKAIKEIAELNTKMVQPTNPLYDQPNQTINTFCA